MAVGGDLAPGTLLAAYRQGLFPMRLHRDGPVAWWSPDPRGVLPLDGAGPSGGSAPGDGTARWGGMIVHRSLRRSARRYRTTVDRAFVDVVRACADERRPGGWIDDEFVAAYARLHALGWAHSVEVWGSPDRDETVGTKADETVGTNAEELVGGCYGVAIGGLFAGESMFHRTRDASKVALLSLVERLRAGGGVLFDVQWCTPHLASLGVAEITRAEYGRRLAEALARPQLRLA